jgi:hypothetical protein
MNLSWASQQPNPPVNPGSSKYEGEPVTHYERSEVLTPVVMKTSTSWDMPFSSYILVDI